jgi:hypothetical protein
VYGVHLQQMGSVDKLFAIKVSSRVLQNCQRRVDACHDGKRLSSREKLHLDTHVANEFGQLRV